MMKNFVIPGFTPGATLTLSVLKRTGVYAMVADRSIAPISATWSVTSQAPAAVPINTDTYIVVKGASGSAFPANVAFSWVGVWQGATVLQNRILLIPVNYAAVGAYTVDVTDDNTDTTFDVTVATAAVTVGSFAITAAWHNTLYSVGGQKVAVEGTGMNGVDSIVDSEGNSLSFVAVDDNWLVLDMAAIATPASITLTFKNAAGTTLGTTAVTVSGTNDLSGEAFFWNSGDIVSAYLDADDADAYAVDGGDTYAGTTADDLVAARNTGEADFTRIVRDKKGAVIAYCPYSVMSSAGAVLFTGTGDEYGVIAIVRSTLPSSFILQYDTTQVPIRREWINL